jgi:hypothetical protein
MHIRLSRDNMLHTTQYDPDVLWKSIYLAAIYKEFWNGVDARERQPSPGGRLGPFSTPSPTSIIIDSIGL